MSKFVEEASRLLGLPSYVIRNGINEKAAKEYIRGRLKEQWDNDKRIDEREIINSMISDLRSNVPISAPKPVPKIVLKPVRYEKSRVIEILREAGFIVLSVNERLFKAFKRILSDPWIITIGILLLILYIGMKLGL